MNDLITQPGFCETPHSPVTTSAKEPVLKPNSSRAQSSWLESESFSSHMMFSLVSSPTTSSEFASLAEQRSLMQSIVGEYGIWKKEQWTQKRNKLTNMKSVKKRSSRIELLHGFGLQVDPAIEVGRHVAFEVWSCQCPTHRLPRTRGIIGSVSSSLGLTYGSISLPRQRLWQMKSNPQELSARLHGCSGTCSWSSLESSARKIYRNGWETWWKLELHPYTIHIIYICNIYVYIHMIYICM